MKNFVKVALGAVMLAGAVSAVAATPAEARVTVGIGIGGPGYYGGYYAPRYNSCDRYSRYYDPYRCDGYYEPAFYGPAYYGYGGPSFAFSYGGGYRGGFHGGGNGGGFHGGGHGGGGHHR